MKNILVFFLLFETSLFSVDLAQRVLNVANLEAFELEELTSKENFSTNEQALIDNLESHDVHARRGAWRSGAAPRAAS